MQPRAADVKGTCPETHVCRVSEPGMERFHFQQSASLALSAPLNANGLPRARGVKRRGQGGAANKRGVKERNIPTAIGQGDG